MVSRFEEGSKVCSSSAGVNFHYRENGESKVLKIRLGEVLSMNYHNEDDGTVQSRFKGRDGYIDDFNYSAFI